MQNKMMAMIKWACGFYIQMCLSLLFLLSVTCFENDLHSSMWQQLALKISYNQVFCLTCCSLVLWLLHILDTALSQKKESMVDSMCVLIFKDLCVIKCVKFSLLCVLPFHVMGKRHLRTEMLQVMVWLIEGGILTVSINFALSYKVSIDSLNAALTEAYFLLCSNFLQPKLYTAHVHFNLSLSIYFNTALIVTCLWLFWYQTKLLLDAKMRREESQIRNNVVTFVGWGLLWCSAPDIPRVLTDIPWRSVAPVLIYACQPLLLPPRSIT